MDKKHKIFYLLGILAILAISFWGIAFNKAYIIVSSNPSTTFQVLADETTHQCQSQCEIELQPKVYDIQITKEGYSTYDAKVILTRGKKELLTYEPIFLPLFTAVDNFEEHTPFQFQTDPQTFQINSSTVTTFRSPLSSPQASLSFDNSYSFIWNTPTSEYYLVNNSEKSRQKLTLTFPNNQPPQEFKLINNNLLLYNYAENTYLHNLETNKIHPFPAKTVKHIGLIDENRLLFFTNRNLDASVTTASTFNQITQLATFDEEQIAEQIDQPVDKIFSYNLDTNSYQFLGLIPPTISEPFYFNYLSIENKPVQVLTTQEESFLIKLSQNEV